MKQASPANPLLEAALVYVARGWAVFPSHTPTRSGCSCPRETCDRIGKHPRTKHGLKDATTDEATIRRWWDMWPQANIGIVTGAGSGLVVLDEDSYKGGDATRLDLERSYSPLPATALSLTGGGGVHYLFAHPGVPVKNGVETLGDGLDIRGDGGYIIAPPSLHASGKQYTWDVVHDPNDLPLAPMPAWLLALCQEASRREAPQAGEPIAKGQRNDTLFKLGCGFRARGCTEAVILAALREMNATQCQPPLDEEEVATIAASCATYAPGPRTTDAQRRRNGPAKASSQHPPPQEPAPLPTIEQYKYALPAVIAQAEEALATSLGAPRMFQRSNVLVVVQPAEPTPKDRIRRVKGAPVIRVCPASTLRYCLAQAATWTAERGKRMEVTMPQPWVVETLLELGIWTHLPVLTGIITAPTLRPDGTLLATPGYDSATGLYYAPGETVFPAIPERPTQADIDEAFEILEEPFQDFPFTEAHHKSALFAALLTTLIRYAIPGHVPLFGISAPTAGTGKTLLVDTLSIIASGRPAPKLSQPGKEEEWNKQLLTCALEGDQLVLIDNCVSTLASGELCKALTAEVLKGRILGAHKNGEAPQHAVYFATGNSLRFRGDIVRRVIPIDLESPLERPETRTAFAIETPLETWTRDHRPALVTAALTILRGYHLAHDKPTVPILGSFEAWCTMICGPLVWLGMRNPLEGVEAIKADDDEREQLRTLLMAWHAVYQEKEVTLHTAKDDINTYARNSEDPSNTYHVLADALKACDRSRDTLLNLDSIGKHLKQVTGRIVCGKTLARGTTRTGAGYPWSVVTKSPCTCAACNPPATVSV